MSQLTSTLLIGAALGAAGTAASVHAQSLLETPRGEAVERHLPGDRTFTQWAHDPSLLGSDAGDRLETREVPSEDLETVKLTNLVPPIHYESGVADIPDSTVAELRKILDGLRGKRNVRLHLVGHADSQPLSPALAAVFGDNEGLSRERAGEAAEFLKRTLELPPEAIAYEWAGDTKPIATNATAEGRALNRRVEVEVWYDEVKPGVALDEVLVKEDFKRIKVCRMETVCRLRYVEGQERRTRVQNLVPPLHFSDESIDVTPEFIERIRSALGNMGDRSHVLVKFVGYTDDQPLGDRNERIYGDAVGLSKARARRVALAVQEALKLPTAAIDSDGRGAVRPLGSNETAEGRALNRRVEVEFWYDDPLQELPDEPQMCPAPGVETVTRVYDPPWGKIQPIEIADGQPIIPGGYADTLRRALGDVAGKTNARLRFIGYTGNERLERRTALVYGDDIGLSAARARRAMEVLGKELGLEPSQAEFEGRGYVQSDDVVNAGFTQGADSYVIVKVVYDEVAQRDDYDGVDVTPLTRELRPTNAFGLNPMHITVDGEPIDDKNRSSEDIQRCTDVALDKADIRFGFDPLVANRRLSVAARPATIALRGDEDGRPAAETARFSMYANYSAFIDRAEVRIFGADQSLEAAPLAVIPIGPDGFAEWQPAPRAFTGVERELKYVLRAYGKEGAFDETVPQPLWLVYGDGAARALAAAAHAPPESALELAPEAAPQDGPDAAAVSNAETESEGEPAPEPRAEPASALLMAYGENNLGLRNITLGSGTVTVRGSAIPSGHSVWVAGRRVPVDPSGNFVAEEILPTGVHTVEVAVLDDAGNGDLFLRDLELERKDWFYVGMADLTLSKNDTHGPIDVLQGENPAADLDSSADARLAFYVNGKFGDAWKLTASADTRDEPLGDLFSNFLDKSPDSLFRRIDSDYHFPTFGDDATVEETAPTLGKFYVKVGRHESYGLWGDFKVGYMDNELAQVDRGLYGANLHYESDRTTSFGERRFAVDGFTAEPGTIASREEFRGTGGSLYYLRRQDILTGSERVRIEYRDRASGLVTAVRNLTPAIDYDIDYLQGRILLSEPLASTAEDDLLVRSNGALTGDEAYLVVRYEYTPGFEDLDALSVGGQAHYWFKERVKVGLTTNTNDDGDADSALEAADVTVRISSDSWLKLQGSSTEGLIGSTVQSNDGGFGFFGYDDVAFANADARGYRADVSVATSDFLKRDRGRLTLYKQSLDGGYSAPGLQTLTDTENYGGTFRMPVTTKVSLRAKADRRIQDQGLETNAQEMDVAYRLTEHWGVSTGVRKDERIDRSPLVPLTQEQGERTDGVMQVEYDSKGRWSAYSFVQETLSVTGDRDQNDRFGTGGSYRLSERLRISAEASDGELGTGGKLGTTYMPSDRTTLYLNYSLENESADNGLRPAGGGGDAANTVAGVKTRLSDSTSVYLEERYQTAGSTSGLTHATGISLAPTDRLNFSASTDIGTLQDALTGAETHRRAAGFRVGWGLTGLQLASGVEYRYDEAQQLDTSFSTRKTWLFRNNFKYQLTPASRLLGKINHSESESSLGQFYDGGYTEAVLGYAYRPVRNDRLNTLLKYTYFYNVPTTDQLTLRNTAAEFVQKSRVAAVDATYDITPRWSLGGKYAHRRGELSLDRVDPEFFDNAANLFVLRADFRFRKDWEGLVEGRLLDLPDITDRRSGSLIVVSRYLTDHVKVGAGYNFTDFSDDLTDLSFDHRGVFLNVTGTM
ncbi:MAG TPA: OmpA family protein [Gammaproteobacteria bacterium]|nr:OmpA family protein [Gammaproteobacteria bacterium]